MMADNSSTPHPSRPAGDPPSPSRGEGDSGDRGAIVPPSPSDGVGDWHQSRLQFLTWDRTPEDIQSPSHRARQALLVEKAGGSFAPDAYVAEDAAIFTTRLVLGEKSWIAGHAL